MGFVLLREITTANSRFYSIHFQHNWSTFNHWKLNKSLKTLKCRCSIVTFTLIDRLGFILDNKAGYLHGCVFWPANRCTAHRSLVEIDFLTLKQLFLSLMKQNKHFTTNKYAKSCLVFKNWFRPAKTACGAPIRWSKYTTICYSLNSFILLTCGCVWWLAPKQIHSTDLPSVHHDPVLEWDFQSEQNWSTILGFWLQSSCLGLWLVQP